jgi:hypothetical protein
MCLDITKESIRETEELKAKGLPIVAYKILWPDMESQWKEFQWKLGENKSDRESAELTEEELEFKEIHEGFHFFINKPEACEYQCQYQDPYLCQNQYLCQHQYRCTSEKPANKVFKVEIKPENLISLGTWNDFQSLAATECKIIEELKTNEFSYIIQEKQE